MSRLLLDALLLYRGPNVEYRILPVKFAFSSCLESIKGEFKLLCVLILLTLFTLCFGSFLSYFGGFAVFLEPVSTRWVDGPPFKIGFS